MTILPIFLDISGGEILLIILVVFLVFGPKKVPEIARQIGKTMNELKRATSDLTREFNEGADQVKKEVANVKSGLHEETEKIRAQLRNTTDEVTSDINQPPNSVVRETQPDISGRNQAAVFQQENVTFASEAAKKASQKPLEDDFTPII